MTTTEPTAQQLAVAVRAQQKRLRLLVQQLKNMSEEDETLSANAHSQFGKGLYAGNAMSCKLAAKWIEEAMQ